VTLNDINVSVSGTGMVLSGSVLDNATVIVNSGASATLSGNEELTAYNDDLNVVVNYGTLSLSGNKFNNAIYNTPSGLIDSLVVVTVMENKTHYVLPVNQNITATICDDNGNPIRVDSYEIYTGNILNPKVIYLANYTNGYYRVNDLIIIQGDNVLTSHINDTSRYSNLVYKGALLVANWKLYNTTLNLSSSVVDGRVIIQVNITPSNATGNVTVYIDDVPYNMTLENGTALLNLSAGIFDAGVHSVVAYYPGYQNYGASIASGNFTVKPNRKAIINITVENIRYGSDALVNVTLPRDATGAVIIYINGTMYYEEFIMGLVNGSVLLKVPGLYVGSYNVTVDYFGDDNYLNGTNNTMFNVTGRLPISIEFNMPVNYTYNETIHIEANTNASDWSTFKLYIDGVYIDELLVIDGIVAVDLDSDLLPGIHSIRLEFDGDNVYAYCVNETNITVNKLTSDMLVNASSINGITLINTTLPSDATGMVIVRLNDDSFGYLLDIVNGTAVLTISNLSPGTYNVTVEYRGDAIYSANVTNVTLIVPVSNIAVNVNDTVYGENATILVNTTGLAGNVTIFVDNVFVGNATINPTTGIAVLNVTGLDVGTHAVTVTAGDIVGVAVFNVDRANATVNVTVADIVVGDNATVNITSNVAYANVTVIVGDKEEKIMLNAIGQGILTIAGLSVGNYTVVVVLENTVNYYGASNTTAFNVVKLNTTIECENITNIINVTVNSTATGYITVTFEGRNYTVIIRDGKASIELPYKVGTYNLPVYYSGDERFNANSTTVTVVIPVDGLTISVGDIDYGENATIVVYVPGATSGNVNITVDNGAVQVVPVNASGVAVYNATGLDAGRHNVTAKYDDLLANATFKVRANATINITVENIAYGNNATVNITTNVPRGNVTVIVGDKKTQMMLDNTGSAIWNVTGLNVGNYTVFVILDSSDYYYGGTNNTVFSVVKLNTTIDANATVNIVNVTVNENATGFITVTFMGRNYTEIIKNGKVSIELPYKAGTYNNVGVYYSGDEHFNANSTNITVVIPENVITVSVNDTVYGENATVLVTVPVGSTGNVTIFVDGSEYGNATIDVVTLSATLILLV